MSGKPFDDAAKKRLAESIISDTARPSEPDDTSTNLPGKRSGNIEIDDADNGFIVTHRRRVDKPTRKNDKGDPMPVDYENHTVRKVFSSTDHDGMMSHVKDVLKSPRHKGDRY